MRTVSDTIARLAALRRAAGAAPASVSAAHLSRLEAFGSNPGALQGYVHIPESLAANAPLVVVLHGCTQTAAAYDLGSGWSQMADRHGFAVLFPQQTQQNNPNTCFNWFSDADSRRDTGEALSIRQMIAAVLAAHPIDPARVFVTGLSAGGAMASVMLATYPEVFAGGAIIAGLPYGCASTIPQAFDRMRGHGTPGSAELAALVRAASPHEGPWPTVSIWHGTADATVSLSNAEAIRAQWAPLHGTGATPDRIETVDGQTRKVWCDAQGREVIEDYAIAGMGHGTPLGTTGADACGQSGAFMLEAGISSTRHICRFWGLAEGIRAAEPEQTVAAGSAGRELVSTPHIAPTVNPNLVRETVTEEAEPSSRTSPPPAQEGVRKVIEDALRSAGLMR